MDLTKKVSQPIAQ